MNGPTGAEPARVSTSETTRDQSTIARMAGGDGAALAELYDRHARPVYSLARRILGDGADAEDVVQEVFSQAWRQVESYDGRRATVIGWLLMMTRTRAIDRLRTHRSRVKTVPTSNLPDPPDSSEGPESVVIGRFEAARVRTALQSLTDVQRRAIELAYYEGLSHGDIAERLGEPLGTIKTRIRTGLLNLRAALRQG